MIVGKVLGRVRQLTHSVAAAPLTLAEKQFISGLLTVQQATIFFSLATYEQRHALRVGQTVCAAGFGADKELLQAALLHDWGKFDPATGKYVPLWGKIANVILAQIGAKNLVSQLATPNPHSWRYIFWLQLGHEQRGAKLAQQTGSPPRVVALIAGDSCEAAVTTLKWADDLN